MKYLKFTLFTRFLNFIAQIENSPKILPNVLLQTIKHDCRSITGSNLRNILLLTTKEDISQLLTSDINQIVYMPVPRHEEWRIDMIQELIEVKWGEVEIVDFTDNEIDNIIAEICTT